MSLKELYAIGQTSCGKLNGMGTYNERWFSVNVVSKVSIIIDPATS